MKRIKTPQSQGRDYRQMLKDYFGKYLYGLEIKEDGGHTCVYLVYFDFKHISTVRRELAQMMPEVEFVKLKRDFTNSAQKWALGQMLYAWMNNGHTEPVIYMQQGDNLVKSSLRDIAIADLVQLELDDDDKIFYDEDSDLRHCHPEDDKRLYSHAID